MQVVEFALDGGSPLGEILLEVHSVPILKRVFKLVERLILGVEQGSIADQKMVVDHLGKGHAYTSER